MVLLSNFMNITMQRISGVKGDSIHPVVIPNETKLNAGQLGCWRSHVNCWHKVIEDGVDTALILEDDADWDVTLKDQLRLLSRILKENGSLLHQGNESSQSGGVGPGAPYGSSHVDAS
jgi:GR25 family glycosyltransferase involved in LPS biosynthesis